VLWHCWLGSRKGIRPVKNMGDGRGGHWLVWMEWRPAGWSVCLPLLIFLCTIKPEVLFRHWLTMVVVYRTTCVSGHPQLRTGRFCCSKVWLPTCPCWRQLAHPDLQEDIRVLLNAVNGATYTASVPHHQLITKHRILFYPRAKVSQNAPELCSECCSAAYRFWSRAFQLRK